MARSDDRPDSAHTRIDDPAPDLVLAPGLVPASDLATAPDLDPASDLAAVTGAIPAGYERWVRNATVFLAGQTVSMFGSSLVQYAILWHLTLTTQSGVVLMAALVCGFVPQAIVSVLAGVWADRLDRKMLVIGADATIAVATLALAVLLAGGADSLWLIYAALVIRSMGTGVQVPAVSALLPQIVPTDQLMRVNGINMSIQSGSMLLSPALAAWLYASFGLQSVLFVDVGTAVIGIGLLLLIPVPRLLRDGEPLGYLDDLTAGLRYVRGHEVVRRVLTFFAVVFVLVVPPSWLTPLMVVRTFGDEVWKLTAMEIAFGVGMMLGGAFLAWWGGLRDRVAMMAGASVVLGLLSVGLGVSTLLWIFLGFMFLLGVAVPFFMTTSQTLLQETVEPEMQGRVFGLLGIVIALGMPLGMLVFGPLSDVVSVQSLLIAGGVLTMIAGAWIILRAPAVAEDRTAATAR